MDNRPEIPLDSLFNNPDYNFLQQFSNFFDNDDDDLSPYGECLITCDYLDEEQFAVKYSNNENLTCLSVNIQSLQSKFNEFSEFISQITIKKCKPDIIALQELWTINDADVLSLKGYHQLIFKSRSPKTQGGGVGFYISEKLKFKMRHDLSFFTEKIYESIFIEILLPKSKNIVIGSIYRPNSAYVDMTSTEQLSVFNETLLHTMSLINNENLVAYLLGDFNIDVLKINDHQPTSNYIENVFSMGFLQLITKPTRCINGHASLIDHVLTNDLKNEYNSCIIINRISDHFPIFHVISAKNDKVTQKPVYKRNFCNANVERFNETLRNLYWRDILDCEDPQTCSDSFYSTFIDLFNLHFPLKMFKFNKNFHKKESWFSNGLLTSRSQKIKLCTASIRDPTLFNINAYKMYRNIYNRLLKASKKIYFEEKLSLHKSDLRKTWQTLREATGKLNDKSSIVESLLINNVLSNDKNKMADAFNEHFTSMAGKIAEKIVPTDRPPDLNHKIFNCLFTTSNSQISTDEIVTLVKNLKPKTSLDMNGVSTSLIKKCILSICEPLRHIFNLSFTTGIVPKQFKVAKIIPIFKSGDKNSIDNYRPISLLCSFSKILEKLMANRLTEYIVDNNILSNSQFGFRKGHSTEHPMILFLNKIAESITKKQTTISIFCDLQKAFDTCDHKILETKLSNIGVRGVELKWFTSYLSKRKQFVSLGGVTSSRREIERGVPQGSILGPLLFLIYINDLPEASSLFSQLFADDTSLSDSDKDLIQLTSRVNTEFQKIVEYFRSNKMLLHPNKTKFMIFNPPRDCNVKIYIDNNNSGQPFNPTLRSEIECVSNETYKFLGVNFDPTLSFKKHISLISSKISKSLYIIQRAKNVLSEKALLTLYYSMIHCHLNYGLNVWSCASKTTIKPLITLQKRAIRTITLSKYNAHTEPLFKKLKILPVDHLIEFSRLLFMHNFTQHKLPNSFINTWLTNQERRGEENRQLRNQEDFYLPPSRTNTAERLPLHTMPLSWNNLISPSLKQEPNTKLFKRNLKSHLLDKLSAIPVCFRVNCPACNPI
jgi:exonuclease III